MNRPLDQIAFWAVDDIVFTVVILSVAVGVALLGGFSGRYRWIGYTCVAIAAGLLMYYEQVLYNKLFPGTPYRLF
jgi:hypothetical protein